VRQTHYRSCTLCEATCGVAVDVDGDQVVAIRGDDADPFSQGYICPKATALADLHDDPDRLRRPMVREGTTWREVGWDEAFDLVARRLDDVRRAHGKDAIAVYQGNPTAHNLGLLTYGQLLLRKLGTKNTFSATSVDQLPHMLAAHLMFGDGVLMPVPDVDRTDYFLCIGGNPLVSNGSIMTAPDMRARLKAIRARGGKVVVVDPRRTETAEQADRHLFIRPGTDALLLLSMLHVVFAERLERPSMHLRGLDALRAIAQDFAPEATAPVTGIAPDDVRALARELAGSRGVAYGRMGVCTQEHGGAAAWLIYAVNAVCGRLDAPGGMMWTTPAVDLRVLAKLIGYDLGFDRYRSRVRGLPEFGGELPVVTMAEEIETPGAGQIRALVTCAGNPVLSSPNGARLDRALPGLDFMVSIDMYLNETTRHAHVILPGTSPLARAHYDVALASFSVRNVAKYAPPLWPRAADERHDWEIAVELWSRLCLPGGAAGRLAGRAARAALLRLGPEAVLDVALRTGAHGLRKGKDGLSVAKLRAAPHGVDLGPLEPRLPGVLVTKDRQIDLVPPVFAADVPRLRARLAEAGRARDGLVLIGRRHLRSNNSWCHNSHRLVKGKPRCTLLVHPRDAAARGLVDGDLVTLASKAGRVRVPVEISDEIMPGVVSMPHGWGHDKPGTRLAVASATPGASVNDVTSEDFFDPLTGTGALSGLTVTVERVAAVRPEPPGSTASAGSTATTAHLAEEP
jgi:anaerobic selenocysteine-containing dehydrogenase